MYTLLVHISGVQKRGLVFENSTLPSYSNDEGYFKIVLEEDHVKYLDVLSQQHPDKNGAYVTENMELDLTSDVFIRDCKRLRTASIIQERNEKLSQSDWTRMDDNGLDEEKREAWRIYRQQLRDLPQNISYNEDLYPVSIPWPAPP